MKLRLYVFSSFLAFCAVGFSMPAVADSKAGKIADSILNIFKGANKEAFVTVSRSEFMETMRSNVFLCYNLSEDGTCAWIEVSESYYSDGFSYYHWSKASDDFVFRILGEVKWVDDKLCDSKRYIKVWTLPSSSATPLVRFDNPSEMDIRNDLKERWVEEFYEIYGGRSTCYSYVRFKDNQQVMLQLEYIDGVLQDSEDFARVTVFEKGEGKVRLHY